MIGKLVGWILNRTGFKGPELLMLGSLFFVAVVGYHLTENYKDAVESNVISEEARQAAEQVVAYREQQQRIDMDIVSRWIREREAYQNEQQQLIDTSYLEFYVKQPLIEEEDVDKDIEPPPSSTNTVVTPPKDPSYATTPSPLSNAKRAALHRGLWDNYCLAIANDDPDC